MAYEKEHLEKIILDASEEQLFKIGYKNLNLTEVAKKINISKTTLYKTFESKYQVAEKIIDRLLTDTEITVNELIEAEIPLPVKLRRTIEILTTIYTKMDREFLSDLQSSLPELWEKIDTARKKRQDTFAALFAKEQAKGVIRSGIDPALLSALFHALVIGVYNPHFFLTHNITPDSVGNGIVDTFLHGILESQLIGEQKGLK